MTETVPEPEPRNTDGDVERPADHEGDTESTGRGREGDSVEGANRTPDW